MLKNELFIKGGGNKLDKVGLVPCAGKGTRLNLPFSKELFPNVHANKYVPVIMYTIHSMKVAGIEHIIFTINPDKRDIIKYLGNGKQFNLKFSYCVHPVPKSLPESLNEAYHLIHDKMVVFAMPDTYIQPDDYLSSLIKEHEKNEKFDVTLGCFNTNFTEKFGMVKFKGFEVVEAIYDKPRKTDLSWMWGAMVWNPGFSKELHQFVLINENGSRQERELILSDALVPLINQKKVRAHFFPDGIYKDLGTYDEIIEWSKNHTKVE